MNEQLQSKLVEIIDKILFVGSAVGDFTMEQLPDIVQTFILYSRIKETLIFGFVVIALFLCIYFLISIWSNYGDSKKDIPERHIVATFILIASLVLFTMSFFLNIGSFIMVWVAPKIYLLIHIKHLLT